MPGFNHHNTALRICVDKFEDHVVSGRVFSCRLTKPIVFRDLGGLVLRLDDVFDQQNFPQAFQRSCCFLHDDKREIFAAQDPSEGMSRELVNAQKGDFATFEVLVVSRRSSSWQGHIDWLDGSPRQEFISYLELMRMADEKLFREYL